MCIWSKYPSRCATLIHERSDVKPFRIQRHLESPNAMRVRLSPDGTALTGSGESARELVEQGWRSFLIRVENPGGLTLPLTSISDAATDEGDLNQQYTVSREPMLNLGNLADLLTDAGPGTDDLGLRSQLSMIAKC